MFEFMKSPIMNKVLKKVSGDAKTSQPSWYNPFDSDNEVDTTPSRSVKPARQVTFEPKVTTPIVTSTNPFDDDEHDDDHHDRDGKGGGSPSSLLSTPAFPISRDKCSRDFQEASKSENQSVHGLKKQIGYKSEEATKTAIHCPKIAENIRIVDCDAKKEVTSTSSARLTSANRCKRDFQEASSSENGSVQELENRAVYKAEETTETIKGCLKIAGDIREDATRTLVMLNHQGEQIIGTHRIAADIDKDLSRGEKLLSSLGGLFSKTWNPMKTRDIIGPQVISDHGSSRCENQLEQRHKLGVAQIPNARFDNQASIPEPKNAIQKVEVEWVKQDDVLSDLSNILGDLKNMAIDMGSEIDRQNNALGHLGDDVDELNYRVKGANQRARRLLGK